MENKLGLCPHPKSLIEKILQGDCKISLLEDRLMSRTFFDMEGSSQHPIADILVDSAIPKWTPCAYGQAQNRAARNMIRMIGHELPEIPPSRNRSRRIWKKLCKRRAEIAQPIWSGVEVLFMNESLDQKLREVIASRISDLG